MTDAIKLDGDDEIFYFNRGLAYYDKGQIQEVRFFKFLYYHVLGIK
jgi:hypothetical protein